MVYDIYLQKLKSETFNSYKRYEAYLLRQKGARIKRLHSDRGGEYLSNAFNEHLAEAGTVQNLTIHDTPEHNGVAERVNRTLLEKVRAMLHASGLPKFLWGEAINHAVYLKNCTGTKALDGKTPYKAFLLGDESAPLLSLPRASVHPLKRSSPFRLRRLRSYSFACLHTEVDRKSVV